MAGSLLAQKTVLNLPTFDKKQLHFGFCIGTNFINFSTQHSGKYFTDKNGESYRLYSDLSNVNPGFHVELIGSYRLGEYFNVRFMPGISFGQRDMQFVKVIGDETTPAQNLIYEMDALVPVKSTFIELPFLFKYKAVRNGNAKPYIVAGSTVRFDLARSKREDVVLKPFDVAIDFGVGSDFYLEYFRFGVEARISVGMMDMLWHDRPVVDYDPSYIQSIDKLKSLLFIIAFNFE